MCVVVGGLWGGGEEVSFVFLGMVVIPCAYVLLVLAFLCVDFVHHGTWL